MTAGRDQESRFGRDFACGCSTCVESHGEDRESWRKVLYVRQPYADNHTDKETFLCDMVMNADVSTPSYWPTVEASLTVAHEAAIVALVVSVFSFHYCNVLTLDSLFSLNLSFSLGGLLLAALAEADVALLFETTKENPRNVGDRDGKGQAATSSDASSTSTIDRQKASRGSTSNVHQEEGGPSSFGGKQTSASSARGQFRSRFVRALQEWSSIAGVTSMYLLLLSPVLHTLTRSISSDTIWCSTTYLLLFHLFLHDYSYSAALSSSFSSYLALLSALFACILLASRLPEPSNAFAFVSFGLQCFSLLPGILHRVAVASERSYRVVVILLLTLSVGLVFNFSFWLGSCLTSLLVFVIFVCPAALVHMHRSYKSTIQGPWDEAKLQATLSNE